MPSGSLDPLNDEGLPSINVTTDLETPLNNLSPSQVRFPSSAFLSPHSLGFRGQLSLSSPTHSDASDAGSVPPSPTLSSHTATNFPTSLQLRDNKPDASSGLTSLNLLDVRGVAPLRKTSKSTLNTDLDGETFRLVLYPTHPFGRHSYASQ